MPVVEEVINAHVEAALVEALRSADAYYREKQIARARRDFASLFRRQGSIVLADMERLVKTQWPAVQESVTAAVDAALADMEVKTGTTAAKAFAKAALAGVEYGYKAGRRMIGIEGSFALPHPQAVEWARVNGLVRAKVVNETTRDEIRAMVVRGLDEGKSYAKVAREIKGRFSQYAVGQPQKHIASRAELVAVTENAYAYESGNRMLIDDLKATGLTLEKRWNVVDAGCCEICDENAAQGWIDSESVHVSGHDRPPAHPACRCGETYQRHREGG